MMKNIDLYQVDDSTSYPIAASALGTNAYYLEYCNVGGHRPAYAACLNRIQVARSGGILDANCNDCTNAIHAKTCPARAMREEEFEVGHALYYVDRSKQQDVNEHNLKRHGFRINREPMQKTGITFNPSATGSSAVAAAVPAATSMISTSGYADAINKAIAAEAAKDTSHPTSSALSLKNKVSADLIDSTATTFETRGRVIPKFASGLSLEQIVQQMKAKA